MKYITSGWGLFVNDVKELGFKEIAKDPDVRFNLWICKQFKVLPTSPDFQNLTFEMREVLWEDYLLDNPKLARKVEMNNTVMRDDEFDEIWDDKNTEDIQLDENIEVPILPDEDDIEYSQYGRNVLDRIQKNQEKQLKEEVEESLTDDEKRIRNIYGYTEESDDNGDWEEIDLDEFDDEDSSIGDDFSDI